MKHFRVPAAGIALLMMGLALPAQAEKITFLAHQKEVNKILCQCQTGKPDCEKKLNSVAAANKNNAKIMVDDVNASICTGYLEAFDCNEKMAESTQGPCSLAELQK